MRSLVHAITAAALMAASPADAQLSNHSFGIDGGFSLRPSSGEAGGTIALTATRWIDGALEASARVAYSSAAETGGRPAASCLSGTLGARLSLLPDPLRPQLEAEIGWARVREEGDAEDRVALGIGGGLEWFPARDASLAFRVSLRGPSAALRAQATIGAAVYF